MLSYKTSYKTVKKTNKKEIDGVKKFNRSFQLSISCY